MKEQRYCDDRLWMEGKEDICRAFIEAMPAAERAKWDSLRIVTNETLYGDDAGEAWHFPGMVFVIAQKGDQYICIPMREELIADTSSALTARKVAKHLWLTYTKQSADVSGSA